MYASNVRSATTFVASDGKSRLIGNREESPVIKSTVLGDGKPYTGAISILNVPFFAVYLPLKDSDGVTVGMLSVGSLQVGVLQAAGRSIELTFLVTVILLLLSILPAYYVSRYIAYQLS